MPQAPHPRNHAWPADLVRLAVSDFPLRTSEHHGLSHWARVRAHGVRLAQHYHLNPVVPALFGLLHDCRRENEHYDPEHGQRAGVLVEELATQGRLRGLTPQEISHLARACADHSEGLVEAPRLVQVCWDADRLDLGRVGIRPDPRLLCTDAARAVLLRTHAYRWSRGVAWREAPDPDDVELSEDYWRPSPRTLG